jgi:hypothetical protein
MCRLCCSCQNFWTVENGPGWQGRDLDLAHDTSRMNKIHTCHYGAPQGRFLGPALCHITGPARIIKTTSHGSPAAVRLPSPAVGRGPAAPGPSWIAVGLGAGCGVPPTAMGSGRECMDRIDTVDRRAGHMRARAAPGSYHDAAGRRRGPGPSPSPASLSDSDVYPGPATRPGTRM